VLGLFPKLRSRSIAFRHLVPAVGFSRLNNYPENHLICLASLVALSRLTIGHFFGSLRVDTPFVDSKLVQAPRKSLNAFMVIWSWIERHRISVRFVVLASSVLGVFLILDISGRNARLKKGSVYRPASCRDRRARSDIPTVEVVCVHREG
jgi:hypothetical protein